MWTLGVIAFIFGCTIGYLYFKANYKTKMTIKKRKKGNAPLIKVHFNVEKKTQ